MLMVPSFVRRWDLAARKTALAGSGIALLLSLAFARQIVQTPLDSIRLSELRDKVVYLSSETMKGRGNGSPQLKLAADYIAEAFRRNGLKPAGSGYLQSFEMFTAELGSRNALAFNGITLSLGRDYAPHYLSPAAEASAPAVFLGYGVAAPHLKFDELAGATLKGRIAVVIDRVPRGADFDSPFNRMHGSDFSSILTKARLVADRGALGLIVIQDPGFAVYSIADLEDTFSPAYSRRFVPMGNVSGPSNPRVPVAIISWDAGRSLVNGLASLRQRIDNTLKPQSVELGFPVHMRVDVRRVPFATQNVVGIVEGSHAELRKEALVIGAHYDHDGESDGLIWPGADDNASGTAALLELAEAFGNGRPAPQRSIVLAAFAGEEKGQVGSEHFVAVSPFSPAQTVAMIQLDMIGRNEEHAANPRRRLERETSAGNANSINVIGSTFSPDLRRHIEEANKPFGLQLKFRYDDTPEMLLQRSDQWPFLKAGIPALFMHTGEHPDYHQPTDTADKINYPKLEKITRLIYTAAARVANSPGRPRYVQP
jgi:hypothetical protein